MRHYYYLPYVFGAVNLFLIGILALILLAISVMDLLGRWKVYKKAPSAHQLPCPSILRGGGFLFAVLCFIMEL